MHRPLTAAETDTFTAWRALALSYMPYMATLLYAFRPVSSPGLGTMACDKWMRLYIDFGAVEPWGAEACAQVLLHECGHIFHDDAAFVEELAMEPKLANIAGDMSINDDLAEAGCAYIASTGVLPSSFKLPNHETMPYYYRRLQDVLPPNALDNSDASCGSVSGNPAKGELSPDDTLGGQAEAAGDSEIEQLRVQTAADVQAHARGRGTVPAGLLVTASGILTPTATPWQRVLGAAIRRAVRSRPGSTHASPTKRDRRRRNVVLGGAGRKVVLPGRRSVKPRIVLVRDLSGSMLDGALDEVNREIVTIARRMRVTGDDLIILDVDTEVQARNKHHNATQLLSGEGGGGTDMRTGIAAAAKEQGVSVIVVLTDGMTPWPEQPVGVPVVACIAGVGGETYAENVPSWIRTVLTQPGT